MLDATGGGATLTPPDLAVNPQESAQSATNKNYYDVKVPNLKIDQNYVFQFQWVFEDGTTSPWSPGYNFHTITEGQPLKPNIAASGGAGFITVAWDGKSGSATIDKIKRVDVVITNGQFGTGTVAYSFTSAGSYNIPAAAGHYKVELIAVSPTGVTSQVSDTIEVDVFTVGETVQSPTNPNGFSSKRILAGIEVSWAGTYSDSTFTGFEAIKIYAGTSSAATSGTYTEVGVMTGNNVVNTIIIPVDGTYVAYGQPVYIHAAAVNKNGTVGTIQANVTNQSLGPGKATDADINDGAVVISKLASDVLTVGNLKAGDINSTSYIRAGSSGSARVELSSATVGSVNPGFYIYNSVGTPVLSAPLNGGLSIVGSGSFTGSITGASGTFSGDIVASNNLFKVQSGQVTATSGTIGGWTIDGAKFASSASNPKIEMDTGLNSGLAQIRVNGTSGTITIDATNGIQDSNGKFSLSPNGTLTINGSITAGSSISGASINVTGNKSGEGSLAGTTSKINFTASNYSISAGSNSWSYPSESGYYNSDGEWVSTGTTQTISTNDVRFTDATYGGSTPGSGFYYGEMWLGSGSSSGSVDLWANYPSDAQGSSYIGVSLVSDSSDKNIYIYGHPNAGFGTYHTTSSSQAPAMLQVDSTGRMTRGRSILTGSSSSPNNGWGLTGDLYFSTAV